MKVAFDIETDGLNPTKIYCIAAKVIGQDMTEFWTPDRVKYFPAWLVELDVDTLIGNVDLTDNPNKAAIQEFGFGIRYAKGGETIADVTQSMKDSGRFSDEQIANAPAEIEGITELDALVAYLQGLGIELKTRK